MDHCRIQSPHLLVSPSPLLSSFPHPLSHLTINIRRILSHPTLSHLPVARLLHSHPAEIRIQSIHLASETLELAVVLLTGQVVYYKFIEGQTPEADEGFSGSSRFETFPEARDAAEITPLGHLGDLTTDGFKPVMILDLNQGSVVDLAVSNGGFLAISFSQRSVCVVDMRGPEVIMREGFGEDGEKARSGESTVASKMTWTACGYGNGTCSSRTIRAKFDSHSHFSQCYLLDCLLIVLPSEYRSRFQLSSPTPYHLRQGLDKSLHPRPSHSLRLDDRQEAYPDDVPRIPSRSCRELCHRCFDREQDGG